MEIGEREWTNKMWHYKTGTHPPSDLRDTGGCPGDWLGGEMGLQFIQWSDDDKLSLCVL